MMPGQNKRKVELLAPAGGMNQLLAAVENGADAVYLGGKLFNARMNATNFTMEELKEGIDYAHLRNVKIYITMNVLIKDEELEDAVKYAATLYQMGIDGIILQDIGLADALAQDPSGFAAALFNPRDDLQCIRCQDCSQARVQACGAGKGTDH